MKPLRKLAAALVVLSVTHLSGPAYASDTDLTSQPPTPIDRSNAEDVMQSPAIIGGRIAKSTFSDRCRAIVEYAQLGEVDDVSLETLRRSCG